MLCIIDRHHTVLITKLTSVYPASVPTRVS